VACLAWVPSYARDEPAIIDIPFFYAYQLAWIGLVVVCMATAAALLPIPNSKGSS